MNIALVLKIAGVGLLVSIAYQILQKNGREEQATFVSIAGVIIVMLLLVQEISSLFSTIRSAFGLWIY
ncbi:MAG: stage III sporulation protein AC [Clostridiales bacterium GWF2_36_10]|nr:MAG: stage III sporulation protein AC [Clostridiales bacterium GWF2_36_10]HAN21093.1 stage III sporulation protein AC [Clostridiales bacterium]